LRRLWSCESRKRADSFFLAVAFSFSEPKPDTGAHTRSHTHSKSYTFRIHFRRKLNG
jgi:hypothetical protein